MPTLVSDVSVFQPANRAYYQRLYNRGVRFNFVKLTEGVGYTNPSAFAQIRSSLSVFGSCGVYHFWRGESANYFLRKFRTTGLDPHSTKFMLDVEAPGLPYYLAGDINRFFKQLIDYGFKPGNLWVYTNQAQFLNTGRIIIAHLKYGFVWAAKYASMSESYNLTLGPWSSFRARSNMWQFNGTGQDLSFDYTGTLGTRPSPTRGRRHPVKKVAPKKATRHYLKRGHLFKVISPNVTGYKDLNFKVKNGNLLMKGSTVTGRVVKYGKINRLDTPVGFLTANTKYTATVK